MSDSTHLALPFLEAAQAQKHVTVNDALTRLDALVHLAVESASLSIPPGSPGAGDRWIVAGGATGDWAGEEGKLAAWIDGAWVIFNPQDGWQAWVKDAQNWLIYSGGAWAGGPANSIVSRTGNEARTRFDIIELDHVLVAGAFNDTSLSIPDRAIVFGLTALVLTDVSGPASWTLGVAADPQRYGNSIGLSAGSTVIGVSGTPTAYYGATSVRVTATGADFTGGTLRLALHYMILDGVGA